MSDSSIEPGGAPLPEPNTYNPIFSSSMSLGTPVAFSTSVHDEVVPAKANVVGTTYAIGVVIRNCSTAGERGGVRYAGAVTLTSWADVLDTGTELETGKPYYVSNATAGKLTKTAPASGYVCPVGFAASPTTLFVQPSFPTAAIG